MAPLTGLPGADYLNALYSADFARLRSLDQAFREPYRASVVGMAQHVAPLANAFAGLGGIRLDYAGLMTKAIDNSSLIVPMFAVYLVEYEGRLGPCLEADARSFKITRASETVYRYGYGYSSHTHSIKHPDQVEYFKVNRRFASVFESVGLTNPNSVLAGLIDNSIRNRDRVGITELLQGTRALMRRMDREGCGSPLMQRMKANMLAYFEQYRERNREVIDASIGLRVEPSVARGRELPSRPDAAAERSIRLFAGVAHRSARHPTCFRHRGGCALGSHVL